MEYKIKRRFILGISLLLFALLYFFKNTSSLLRIFATLAGLVSFYIFDHYFNINFELKHYLYILIIAFFGILLSPLYFISENYDKILHLVIPILTGGIVFFLVNKQNLTLKWKLVTTLLFTISILTIFEVIEFSLDKLWDLKLQGIYIRDITGLEKFNIIMDKNDDTMIDLIIGILGSLIFTFYNIIKSMINRVKWSSRRFIK
ncbi:hypothetical protein CMI39_02360 [Candidatus Pacearchaeota archaeon]|jgi:hypothetical protein|nr:hypothetical protein [Candidatus Pacearchaeota archaeon]|tara:strand:- start:6603 stop:7211 length:609 start_codon:yes stop_codon:yes gene_type:complete